MLGISRYYRHELIGGTAEWTERTKQVLVPSLLCYRRMMH